MDRVEEYLRIPTRYGFRLGGLRWAVDREAIECQEDKTFAFAGEVVSFLEGFATSKPFLVFGHMLHLLALLRNEFVSHALAQQRLSTAFREAGRVHRNAGVFCALLSRNVPSAPDPPGSEQVWQRLVLRSFSTVSEHHGRTGNGEEPPLGFTEFAQEIEAALATYTDEEVFHWLKYGTGPVKNEAWRLAQAIQMEPPRSLRGTLEQMLQHDRLVGAEAYVGQLVSALTLPPRRLGPPELPLGGYSDVTNKGQPDQILPGQFALDTMEFLRRFAERELLYYRREEPPVRTREQLVVLLDQGVRTWGSVRLILAAAVLALGRLAEKRQRPYRLAFTSNQGIPVDPLEISAEELTNLVQTSDLTANPALALERTLEDETSAEGDVILLTHPFSLAEPDVGNAARRVRPGSRLFGLGIDDQGRAVLSEFRGGTALPLQRFHVHPETLSTPPVKAARVGLSWKGDVEPIGFPFRFGVDPKTPLSPLQFAFDYPGEHLLIAATDGMLFATDCVTGDTEVVPRGVYKGQVLRQVETVLGVAGGFVVYGVVALIPVVFHYRWVSRICKAHPVPLDPQVPEASQERKCFARWHYERSAHILVLSRNNSFLTIDLDRGARPDAEETGMKRAAQALAQARRRLQNWPLEVGASEPPVTPVETGYLLLESSSGTLRLQRQTDGMSVAIPQADGLPMLKGWTLASAQLAGQTLAILCLYRHVPYEVSDQRLCLFRLPGFSVLQDVTGVGASWNYCLSSDGRLVARQGAPNQVWIQKVEGGRPILTPRGGFHSGLILLLQESTLAMILERRILHQVRWDQGEIVHRWNSYDSVASMQRIFPNFQHKQKTSTDQVDGRKDSQIPSIAYDPHRFQQVTTCSNLVAIVDRYGQVFLYTHSGTLLCALFAFQKELALWMPDGTCHGPVQLLGRPSTPRALELIGKTLFDATSKARR